MRIPIYQVNAFAEGSFTGNPAAVCPLPSWIPDSVMQGIAAENNLSETAFFVARDDGDFDLRWFTPTVEVDLCGHATLASGHVILDEMYGAGESVRFHTRSGELSVTRQGKMLALDLPAKRPIAASDTGSTDRLERVLGIRPVAVLNAGLPVAVLGDEKQVAKLRPDFRRMVDDGLNWISVTAQASGDETDFVSRYFAPGSGIDEDPVTGSAHAWLTPYWSGRLGKRSLVARQVSARGGRLWCRDEGERVTVAGHVTGYLNGQLAVPEQE